MSRSHSFVQEGLVGAVFLGFSGLRKSVSFIFNNVLVWLHPGVRFLSLRSINLKRISHEILSYSGEACIQQSVL